MEHKLKQWLDAEKGRATALAKHLGLTISRVSQMAVDGVPNKYMLSVRDYTEGAVSVEAMVTDRTPAPPQEESQAAGG